MIDTGLVLDIAPCINSRPFNKLHCNLNEKAKEYFLLMIYRTMCHPAFKKVEFFQGCDFKLSFSNQIEIQNNQHLQKKSSNTIITTVEKRTVAERAFNSVFPFFSLS